AQLLYTPLGHPDASLSGRPALGALRCTERLGAQMAAMVAEAALRLYVRPPQEDVLGGGVGELLQQVSLSILTQLVQLVLPHGYQSFGRPFVTLLETKFISRSYSLSCPMAGSMRSFNLLMLTFATTNVNRIYLNQRS